MAGLPGTVSAASPRWLRLTRSGDTITGYDSADGTHWTGRHRAAGRAAGDRAGRAVRRHPGTTQSRGQSVTGSSSAARSPWPPATSTMSRSAGLARPGWAGTDVGGGPGNGAPGAGFRQAGGTFTVTGTGDIAPAVAAASAAGPPSSRP